MASARQIEATYDYMDELFRATFGPHADITGGLFDGNVSCSLEEAQRRKHEYVLRSLRIEPGHRVFEIGCGWGPMLNAIRSRGAHGIGVTLSPAQRDACRRDGLDARLVDWKELDAAELGAFDAVVSIGAFEHFASKHDYLAGRQQGIYRDFFALCHRMLRPGGRLFLDTMTWGKNAPSTTRFSIAAPRGSDERLLAVLERFYPGSWLPYGPEQIEACAEAECFRVAERRNGRADYIETMKRWGRVAEFSFPKLWAALKSLRFAIRDRDLRWKIESLAGSYNRLCFERGIMDHFQIVFERIEPAFPYEEGVTT
jgi:cyclopropane-fatty-acyl-phospholipid synthase